MKSSNMQSTGIGYITIPNNVDRKRYISSCYRRERVDIQLDNGGTVIKNCYISKNLVSELSFPDTWDKLGSAIAFIVPVDGDVPVIVGVINRPGDTQLLDENIYKKTIKSKAGLISVEMNTEGGIFINVDSQFEKEGNIFLTLKSKNNTSTFNVKCFGDINIYSEGETSLEVLKSVHLRSLEVDKGVKKICSEIELNNDGFKYVDKNKNNISANKEGKIVFHEGRSPVPKGDVLQSELMNLKNTLDMFIDTYLETITAVGAGGATAKTLMEAALFLLRKENFSNINSQNLIIK